MVKLHLWKSELGLIITALEERSAKKKPSGTEQDLYQSAGKKLRSAYNQAER